MPTPSARLSIPLPIGTEVVSRQAFLDIFNQIDAAATTLEEWRRPFFLRSVTYDQPNARLVLTVGPGRVRIGGTLVEKANDTTVYVANPLVNTSYTLYVGQDGAFSTASAASGQEAGHVTNAEKLHRIDVGATLAPLAETHADIRSELPVSGSAPVVMENGQYLTARETGGAVRNLAGIDGANVVQIGSSAVNTTRVRASTQVQIEAGGGVVAYVTATGLGVGGTPAFMLDVFGNSRISGTLSVGGGMLATSGTGGVGWVTITHSNGTAGLRLKDNNNAKTWYFHNANDTLQLWNNALATVWSVSSTGAVIQSGALTVQSGGASVTGNLTIASGWAVTSPDNLLLNVPGGWSHQLRINGVPYLTVAAAGSTFASPITVNATDSIFNAGPDSDTIVNIGIGGASPTTNRAAYLFLNAPSSASFLGEPQVFFRRNGANIWRVGIDRGGVDGAKLSNTDFFLRDSANNYRMALTTGGNLRIYGTSAAAGEVTYRVDNAETTSTSRAGYQMKTGVSASVWQLYTRNGQLVMGVSGVADYATIDASGNVNASGNVTLTGILTKTGASVGTIAMKWDDGAGAVLGYFARGDSNDFALASYGAFALDPGNATGVYRSSASNAKWRLDTSGNVVQSTGYYSIGASATTGTIRLPNVSSIYYRAGGTTDRKVWDGDGSSNQTFGDPFGASITLNAGAAGNVIFSAGGSRWQIVGNDSSYRLNPGGQYDIGTSTSRIGTIYGVASNMSSHSSLKEILGEAPDRDVLDAILGTSFYLYRYRHEGVGALPIFGFKADDAHRLISPDGWSVNPVALAAVAMAGVKSTYRSLELFRETVNRRVDAHEDRIAALETEVARLRELVSAT